MSAGISGFDEFGLPKITDDELDSRLNKLTQNFDNLFSGGTSNFSLPPPSIPSPSRGSTSPPSTPAPPQKEVAPKKEKDTVPKKEKETVSVVYKTKTEKNSNLIKNWTREWMWDFLERQNLILSDFPRPCFNEIPNFINANNAATLFSRTKTFESAKVVFVSPCCSLTYMRELVLRNGKTLYTRNANFCGDSFLTRMDKSTLKKPGDYILASKKKGFKSFGKPVKCRMKSIENIDMMIVGSVVVNNNGARIGDGSGFSDLDWAVLFELGAVNRSTTIVTLVDSVQILDDNVLPNAAMDRHDIPVDVIVTKKVVNHVKDRLKKPDRGVMSHLLSKAKMSECSALKFFI